MNKTFIALATLLAVASYGYINSQSETKVVPLQVSALHQTWMLKNNKVYASPEEQQYRLAIFNQSYQMVMAHNANKEATWTMELNQFSDMSDEEIQAKYLGDRAMIEEAIDGELTHEVDSTVQAPSRVDHRKYVPTTVLNQGRCGSCWAYASASTAEAEYNRATGKMLQFSTQQLLACSGAGSCKGGIHPNALYYYTKTGAAQYNDYPYEGTESFCRTDKLRKLTPKFRSRVTVSGSYTKWESAVATRPVAMSMWVNRGFMMYKGGIFDDSTCTSTKQGGHAVTIVGYTSDYWLVKNSWGGNWGESGYFRIAKQKNSTGRCEMYRRGSYAIF